MHSNEGLALITRVVCLRITFNTSCNFNASHCLILVIFVYNIQLDPVESLKIRHDRKINDVSKLYIDKL